VEVKQTRHIGNGIRAFLADNPDAIGGLVPHSGTETRGLGERIMALPWTMITG
jgi:hypothetical protein